MERFRYQARSRSGAILDGEQEAESRKAVADGLFAKDLTPITIESAGKIRAAKNLVNIRRGVPMRERVLFSRQFATMISAGIPIVRAINVLKKQTENPILKTALTHISKDVEGGKTLSQSLAKYPKIFTPIYVSMVHAGEIGGILDQVLERLADQMEKDAELISKVRGAMVYPGLIFCVMIFSFAFIMTVVVPQLITVFDQINTDLPWNTKLLIEISKVSQRYGFMIAIGLVVAAIAGFRYIKANSKARKQVHALELKIPVLSAILTKINLARFARTLGSLLGSGIPVLEALQVVGDSITNLVIHDEMHRVSRGVKNGSTLAHALSTSHVFPSIVPEMIAVGEETGELEKILEKLADFYDKEVSSLVANLSSVIEPLMLIIMGSLVGFIIISVIGPLYQLTGSF
ncbi:type II secretion system F family protein [bacterium]|nr:type II secretion system F family protein [bacterium]